MCCIYLGEFALTHETLPFGKSQVLAFVLAFVRASPSFVSAFQVQPGVLDDVDRTSSTQEDAEVLAEAMDVEAGDPIEFVPVVPAAPKAGGAVSGSEFLGPESGEMEAETSTSSVSGEDIVDGLVLPCCGAAVPDASGSP